MSETSLRIGLGRQGQGAELGSGMEHAGCRERLGLEKEKVGLWDTQELRFGDTAYKHLDTGVCFFGG